MPHIQVLIKRYKSLNIAKPKENILLFCKFLIFQDFLSLSLPVLILTSTT